MSEQKPILIATEQDTGQRVDNFVMKQRKQLDRSNCYKLIRKGQIRVNGKRCKPMLKLAAGDAVRIPPHVFFVEARQAPVEAADQRRLMRQVLFMDDDYVVLNKPAGLPVHAGSGHAAGVIEIMQSMPEFATLQLAHRLDRHTSGCLLLSRHRQALLAFQAQLKSHQVMKTYWAVLCGELAEIRVVDVPLNVNHRVKQIRTVKPDPINGKTAKTTFKPIKFIGGYTLTECQIEFGRTHQIRAHAQYMDLPLLGDVQYGGLPSPSDRLVYLHAHSLAFSGYRFEAPNPGCFTDLFVRAV